MISSISYTSADRAWAEWIGWQFEEVGYSVTLQAWDFRPGADFIHEMHRAVSNARRTVAILSPDYFVSKFGEVEWRAIFARDPTGESALLVPVRVSDFEPSGLLATRVYIDLVNMNADEAREALLRGVSERGARPTKEPRFPGQIPEAVVRPVFPGRKSGRRHMPLEGGVMEAPPGYIEIYQRYGTKQLIPSGIAIKPTEYESLEELLDELFLNYLHCCVEPYSYGSEWILVTSGDEIIAPVEWVRARTQPIRRVAPAWASSVSLEDYGIQGRLSVDIADAASVRPFALLTNIPKFARIVKMSQKPLMVLGKYLMEVPNSVDLNSYRYKLVLNTWLNELDGKVLTEGFPVDIFDMLTRDFPFGGLSDENA